MKGNAAIKALCLFQSDLLISSISKELTGFKAQHYYNCVMVEEAHILNHHDQRNPVTACISKISTFLLITQ